jgi:DNA-binding transcriptional LysR family regulator
MSPTPLAQRITLRHLRLIAAIAEHRQLSLAAQALSLTQPAASRSLGEIEQLCGAAIFERHARGMTLTPAGELLARRARNVLEEIGEASAEVARYRDGRGGMVRIGAVTGGAIGTIVPVVRQLRRAAPEVEIHVEVAMSRELVRDLLALRLDFVLARLPPEARASEFEVVRARREIVDIVVGAAHPLAGRREVGLTELLACDWVMQGGGAPIRAAIEEALLAAGAGDQHLVAPGDDRDAGELRGGRAGQPRGGRAARRRRAGARHRGAEAPRAHRRRAVLAPRAARPPPVAGGTDLPPDGRRSAAAGAGGGRIAWPGDTYDQRASFAACRLPGTNVKAPPAVVI